MVYFNNGKPYQVDLVKKDRGSYRVSGKTTIRIRDIKRIISIDDTTEYGTYLSRVLFKSGGSVIILSNDADVLSRYM
jgi:hypothetical protein